MFRNRVLFIVLLLLIFCISLEFNKEYFCVKKIGIGLFLYPKRYFFTLVSIQRHPSNSSETVASEYYEQKSPLVGVKNVRN